MIPHNDTTLSKRGIVSPQQPSPPPESTPTPPADHPAHSYESYPATPSTGVCNLNQQSLQRIFHSPIQIKSHLVQPSEPFGIKHALVDKAPRNITLLDELCDQMFPFPACDRAQFLEYDVSEEIENCWAKSIYIPKHQHQKENIDY
jgi:hypothetical protein